jgi:hypothetical protein
MPSVTMLLAAGAVCACRAFFHSSSWQVSCELLPLAYARGRPVAPIANGQRGLVGRHVIR